MKGTATENALAVLGDYLFELETKDKRSGRSYGQDRSVAAPRAPEPAVDISQFDARNEYAAQEWEREQLKVWKAAGRITEDGFLCVGRDPLRPYSLEDLMRIVPHLNVFDRLAALIDLDGVVKEGYLDSKEHENIKTVVEAIADERLVLRLQDEDTTLRLRDLIRIEVGAIFGELMTRIKSPVSTQGGHKSGRMNKCSKCHQPGHRATTCGKKSELLPPADKTASAAGAEEAPQ